jgi:hypothetical protein
LALSAGCFGRRAFDLGAAQDTAIAAPLTAFEHIAHAEIAADLLRISGTATKD